MRKNYLDNIRWGIVVLVVLYHILYLFNSVGVVSNINAEGIPVMDTFLYIVYPWFMTCLFVVAGISARYSLQKRSDKEFIKERIIKLLIPSVAGIFVFGWISGYITSRLAGIFAGADIPAFAKYLIYSMMGIGPLWFAHELFLASLILIVIRKIDRNDRIWKFCRKCNIFVILLLFFGVWGSSYVLNTPVVIVYRNGIYIFMFLLGYYVFSHMEVLEILKKWKVQLLIAAIASGILFVKNFYGQNYTSSACLQHPLTNLYAWLMILAVLGVAGSWFNFSNSFTKYMTSRSFAIYVVHYPFMVLITYLITAYLHLPPIVNYLLVFISVTLIVPCICEIIIRLPVIRFLTLGITKDK